ncbi:GNAT family N-acetyltransferase [soil metagenome]
MISVARTGERDRADWERLWSQWQAHMHGTVPQAVTDRTWTMLCDGASGLHALIARDDEGAALGFAHVSLTPFAWTGSQIMFLQDLFVAAGARSDGVGAGLLRAVYSLADKLGATQVFWMVDEADARLQAFYARHAVRTPYLRYMRQGWPW